MTDRWVAGFESSFIDAAAAWSLSDGNLKGKQLSDYLQTRLRYVDYDIYRMASRRLAAQKPSDPRVALEEDAVSMGLVPLHFIYMDVGCWAGDGRPGWTRHREFGLVCGHLALLCSFSKEPSYYVEDLNCPKWSSARDMSTSTPFIEANVFTHPDFPRVREFLDSLGFFEDLLGPVYILGATMVSSPVVPVPKTGKNEPITVLIGDLHAPVATNSGNAHVFDEGRELLLGRLNLEFDFDPRFLTLQVLAAKAAWFKAEIQREIDLGAEGTREVVDRWLNYYHQPERRTADIFQGAGEDLRTFAGALRTFHESAWPLKVVQVGDFFDLWLGFRPAFRGSVASERNLVPGAMDFARLWVEKTLFKTEQGAGLIELLTLSQTAKPNNKTGVPLQTEFLYGNHDNYRKFGIDERDFPLVVPDGHAWRGLKLPVFNAPSRMRVEGLWVEHGHQPDTANCDEDPSFGHQLTQLVFVDPGIRHLEGFAIWLRSMGEGKVVPRTVSIEHAMKCCLVDPHGSAESAKSHEPFRGIYVMGHSHQPMLKRIELWPRPPRKKATR